MQDEALRRAPGRARPARPSPRRRSRAPPATAVRPAARRARPPPPRARRARGAQAARAPAPCAPAAARRGARRGRQASQCAPGTAGGLRGVGCGVRGAGCGVRGARCGARGVVGGSRPRPRPRPRCGVRGVARGAGRGARRRRGAHGEAAAHARRRVVEAAEQRVQLALHQLRRQLAERQHGAHPHRRVAVDEHGGHTPLGALGRGVVLLCHRRAVQWRKARRARPAAANAHAAIGRLMQHRRGGRLPRWRRPPPRRHRATLA